MELDNLGYSNSFCRDMLDYIDRGCIPARIARVERELYIVLCENGQYTARISGKMRNSAENSTDFPTIGDWVAMEPSPCCLDEITFPARR
jgi:ribosome biogenesis GTPase